MIDPISYLDGRAIVHSGDCAEVIRTFADNSIDACVCDPPYALTSIVNRFGERPNGHTSTEPKIGATGVYNRSAKGFMGKVWDNGSTAFSVDFWREVWRVLKPGGYVLAFGGTRTYHRLACAIEDAGFECRDAIMWHYGTGFPKSHNQSSGWGTALKPATEIIFMGRKPLIGTVADNMYQWGTGAINIDGCRIGSEQRSYALKGGDNLNILARPNSGDNVGRWPANIIHDGSEEVLELFPKTTSGNFSGHRNLPKTKDIYGNFNLSDEKGHIGDSGSATRFFKTASFTEDELFDANGVSRIWYGSKANAAERMGSKHPTVKPIALMRYLCRLVTPLGGAVLDPFAGTGTTGQAAWQEGFSAILIEREAEYLADIERRMQSCETRFTEDDFGNMIEVRS